MDDSHVAAQSSSPRENETDAELAARFQREALPLLDPLYRGALALTGDRSEAEDLLQETMINAYRQLGSLPESTNLRASLYRALTTAYLSICRAGHHQLAECPTDTTTDRPPPGFMKALVAAHDDLILGFTMIGPETGEVMAAVQMTILAGLPYTRLRDAIQAHPTMAEGLGALFSNVPQPIHGPTTPRLKG